MVYLLEEAPEEVSARLLVPAAGIDDVCFATLGFPSGVGASLHVRWIDPRKTRLMTVVGDKKMAVFNDVSPIKSSGSSMPAWNDRSALMTWVSVASTP